MHSQFFLRFLFCYCAGIASAQVWRAFSFPLPGTQDAGGVQLIFVAFAFLGAFLTVSLPFLHILCVTKAFFDTSLVLQLLHLMGGQSPNVLLFNVCLLYLALSLVIFFFFAARAALFAYFVPGRDWHLIFSSDFLLFLACAVICLALSAVLYYIWPQLAVFNA